MGTKNNPGAFDCYEHADPDEPMFVLLARDRFAPEVVREWARAREAALRASDVTCTPAEVIGELDQLNDARAIADAMEVWRHERNRGVERERRVGARLNCGCWWADPPGGIEAGYMTDCPWHGPVGVGVVNVKAPADDNGAPFIERRF